mgnify:CR=1 FL=1
MLVELIFDTCLSLLLWQQLWRITPTAFGSGKKFVLSKICVNQIHIKQSIQHVGICIIVEEFMFFLVC